MTGAQPKAKRFLRALTRKKGEGCNGPSEKAMTAGFRHVYGPVPSRRLGRSLGIDLVPYKTCTYDCVYCHLGRTTNKTVSRAVYVEIDKVLEEMDRKLRAGPAPDYISLAGSGEPTLHLRIGDLIGRIKERTRIPVAVFTNGSLLWKPEVRDALMEADLVIPSLDAGNDSLFHYVNRPHKDIAFEMMVRGLAEFTEKFSKSVWLEVFLLAGITGIPSELERISALVKQIRPERVQLNTVCRPPAEDYACALSREQMLAFRSSFPGEADIIACEEMSRSQTAASLLSRDADILELLGRRPCTIEDVERGLGIDIRAALKHLNIMVAAGEVKTVVTGGQRFYLATRAHQEGGVLK